ncbi:homeobox-leucine zipper protein ATHB-15-like [Brassica napus]|uniref:homeobox-leucine zipper protein ATHB-15-like n=1 Tax=Brassica napus TaxID=3708 RepID=UPI00207A7C8C|nr:homeobox-leucine zipper protein ATHB-15-like [Brassica napus]
MYGIAADILSLSSSFDCITFCWISSERNLVADRLAKHVLSVGGFDEAVNGFTDEGWSLIGDSMDDVTITNVPPAILLRCLREQRSEWADNNIDAYLAAAAKVGPCSARVGGFGGQVILPLGHTIEHEEFMEAIKLEGLGHSLKMQSSQETSSFYNGMDENAVGTWAELIFAQLMLLLLMMHLCFLLVFTLSLLTPQSPNQALDLVSVLEIGPARTTKASTDQSGNSGTCAISVMTIAFEFGVESHMQEHVASMARQYVRGILSPVQRVSLALSPSHISSQVGLRTPLGTPEAQTLARWICQSYRSYMGVELLKSNGEGSESILKNLWHHTDAIICCSMKAMPVFTFANQAGLDMFETTLVSLLDISLEKIFDDNGGKVLCS